MVNYLSNFTFAERIESLKAGTLAGISLFLTFGAIALGNNLILAHSWEPLANLEITNLDWDILLQGAIAFVSGFLFGVTYRYIIRQDKNPHLKSGAVVAFGTVRGLGQIDGGLNSEATFFALWPLMVLGIESVVAFAVVGLVLDLGINQKWINPFPASPHQD
ncbi:MAG: hypothetical protein F6K40_14965 [Okeania sp. SIO3I5]|uniref:hypothetical protein n=1 Tax=Okeania sp. SIO3I5 TaxID=2607805 RepID=UPI0013BAC156|nr:hypothetical protein [Okeania sp. SIO3I5]NEQ37498.1 hypothetical protein [Okeania sp. SIO3I5]